MRNAGRLKLGYFPLPIEEARNIRRLLVADNPFFAIDPCAGEGVALLEILQGLPAHPEAVELDADRAAACTAQGIPTVHGSVFDTHLPAEGCSLLYLNPPYDVEIGRFNNQRMESPLSGSCLWLAQSRRRADLRDSGRCTGPLRETPG